MSGDSTKECDRVLFSGSSGWSMRNEPADFESVPMTWVLPYTRSAFVTGQFGDWQRIATGPSKNPASACGSVLDVRAYSEVAVESSVFTSTCKAMPSPLVSTNRADRSLLSL